MSFNISHCGDVVIFAITAEPAIGVDVDGLTPHINIDEIAPLVFSASERAWMDGLPPIHRREAFLAIWTCKEACLKATGLGLSLPPAELSVSLNLDNPTASARRGSTEWFIRRFKVADELLGAYAVKDREPEVAYWSVNPGKYSLEVLMR